MEFIDCLNEREWNSIKSMDGMEVWAPFINHQQFLFHSTSTKSNFFDLCCLVDGRNAELIEQAAPTISFQEMELLAHQFAFFASFTNKFVLRKEPLKLVARSSLAPCWFCLVWLVFFFCGAAVPALTAQAKTTTNPKPTAGSVLPAFALLSWPANIKRRKGAALLSPIHQTIIPSILKERNEMFDWIWR